MICESLKTNIALTNVSLRDLNAGIKGIRILSDALKVNTTITELNLEGNRLGS